VFLTLETTLFSLNFHVTKFHCSWHQLEIIVVYLTSGPLKREWNGPLSAKKAQFTQERVEYNVFLFDEPLRGSKSLKIFKISLTFRFDKLWHLSKPAHTGEISQILTVSNKKFFMDYFFIAIKITTTTVCLHQIP
jgi:hypothetical protein